MAKTLVIVESPAKAKTIENYLGKETPKLNVMFFDIESLPTTSEVSRLKNYLSSTL